MNLQSFTAPAQLEKNSFLWSQARLVIAAVALFLGGIPPVIYFIRIPALYGPISSLLQIAWIISGLASGYLVWRWNEGGKTVFGGKNRNDTVAFFVSVVSGINLGLTGLLSNNIGMSIASGRLVFLVVGAAYLASAWYLQKRFRAHGDKVF